MCSPLDNPCKKLGRKIAKNRAVGAINQKKDIAKTNRWYQFYKGQYDAQLDDFEKKLFGVVDPEPTTQEVIKEMAESR